MAEWYKVTALTARRLSPLACLNSTPACEKAASDLFLTLKLHTCIYRFLFHFFHETTCMT